MFIPLSILGGLTSAIPGVYQLFQGMKQTREAKQGLEGLTRPKYETPEEVGRMLNISQNRYADKFMPGQAGYMDKIEQQAANAFGQSSEAGNPFAAITNIQAQAGSQLQDVNTQQLQMNMQNEAAYKEALMGMSTFKDREWQINEFAPYKDKYTEFRDMYGAGAKNTFGALDSLSSIGTSMLGSLLGPMGGMSFGGKKATGSGTLDPVALKAAQARYYGTDVDQTAQQGMDMVRNVFNNSGTVGGF